MVSHPESPFAISCGIRFGNTGSLSVKEMGSTQKPPRETSRSPGTANVLDINNSTLVFVGGLGGQIKVGNWLRNRTDWLISSVCKMIC
jgi:hypothetical protein